MSKTPSEADPKDSWHSSGKDLDQSHLGDQTDPLYLSGDFSLEDSEDDWDKEEFGCSSGLIILLKPHGPLSSGTTAGSAPVLGLFSLPGILCIILGALLFLVLIILGIQLHRWRAEHQGRL